jgi:heat shock protein HtpX
MTSEVSFPRRSLRQGAQTGGRRLEPLDRVYVALGDRLGESLEREVSSGASLRPRWTLALTSAAVIATMVYAGALGIAAAGATMIAVGWPNAGLTALGAVLLGFGLVTCPRPFGRSRALRGLRPESIPQLHAAIEQVARALEVSPPDIVLFDMRFNASWGHDGWRQRRVLRLGVPLLASLDVSQTIALLAHELAHERNGDARRGRIIGSSLASLSSVIGGLAPQRTQAFRGLAVLGVLLANALLWLCRQPLRGLLALQVHLLFRDSQRAEYLADDLAASVAGTDAVIALHDSTLAATSVQTIIRRVTLTDDRAGSTLIDDLRAATSASDPEKRAERRRLARAERRRLDSTHPTTTSRIAVLEQRPSRRPTVVLDAGAEAALDAELHSVLTSYAADLIDYDSARLYSL